LNWPQSTRRISTTYNELYIRIFPVLINDSWKIQTSNFTHQLYISDDEITKQIWTAYFVIISCTGAIYCTAVTSYCPRPKITPSTLIFPSGLKGLRKY